MRKLQLFLYVLGFGFVVADLRSPIEKILAKVPPQDYITNGCLLSKPVDKNPPEKQISALPNHKDSMVKQCEDATLKFPDLVKKYGYPCEEYEVQTEDGYLLTLFRIPRGKTDLYGESENSTRPVVFLMHGLVCSSDNWVIMGPEKSLAYLLADTGYDVWLGNARGNTYSKKHVTMNPKNPKFWLFSWDEIGRLDLPAIIDFILSRTGEEQISYVGHSQGTTTFFVLCSMRPEYNEKIKVMFALAPVAWMSNAVSPLLRFLSPSNFAIRWVVETLGTGEFLSDNHLSTTITNALCKESIITKDICSNAMFLVTGFNEEQLNTTMLPIFMGHNPAGASIRQFVHYSQLVVSKKFAQFDFGFIENLFTYGISSPPDYNLTKITAPVSLFYSNNDWLSHPIDLDILNKSLGNVIDLYLIPDPHFQHMDYVWAKDVDKLVNKRVIKMIRSFLNF